MVPPLVGVAVNETLVPAQTGLDEEPIKTFTGKYGLLLTLKVLTEEQLNASVTVSE